MTNEVSLSFTDEPPGCICPKEIEEFILTLLEKLKHKNWFVSLLFCNDEFIQNLNKQYRNIDSPTDVLSFEQGDEFFDEQNQKRFNAGDIVISLNRLEFNSKEFSVGMNEELKRLIIHGILHLSGMDHSDNSPEQPMLKLQEELLSQYNGVIIYKD